MRESGGEDRLNERERAGERLGVVEGREGGKGWYIALLGEYWM